MLAVEAAANSLAKEIRIDTNPVERKKTCGRN